MAEPKTMVEWRSQRPLIYRFRWWLFNRLSDIGWKIAPEPGRSALKAFMNLSKEQRDALKTDPDAKL